MQLAAPPRHLLQISQPPPAAYKLPPAAAIFSINSRRILPSFAASADTSAAVHCPATETWDPPDKEDTAATAFWDYQILFQSQRAETSEPLELRAVDGVVPANFPRGTYFLAGPGIFSDDYGSTVHPLDGHGYLRAFEFVGGGAVRYAARYVETDSAREEREEATGGWRFTHRGPFSVLRGGRRVGNVKVMKNVANTGVLRWGGRLMCLWEGGDPYEIDPRSMGTIGTIDLIGGGAADKSSGERRRPGGGGLAEFGFDVAAALLRPVLYGVFRMPAKRTLSHYKIDGKRNRLIVVSCNAEDMILPRSNFTFCEFDSKLQLQQKKEFSIDDHLMIHDWAFTENHYILIGNRMKLDLAGSLMAVSGASPMISALSVNPSSSRTPVYLLPRFGSRENNQKRDWRKPVEAESQLWISHVANAFEEDDGAGSLRIQIQASACSYRWFNFQKMFGYNWERRKLDPSFMNAQDGNEEQLPHLIRVDIDLGARGECVQCTVGNSGKWSRSVDFPAINGAFAGRRNKFMYGGTASGTRRFLPHFPYDSVVKMNFSDETAGLWWAGSRKFIGEPIFVASGTKEEDDGYVLVVEYAVSKMRCYLVILDAKRIGIGNAFVARLEVPKHLYFPLGFHGFWDGCTDINRN